MQLKMALIIPINWYHTDIKLVYLPKTEFMKRIILLLIFLPTLLAGQNMAPSKYWIQFTDKHNSPYSITNPSQFLSAKAIARRQQYNIPIQQNDLPVNPAYVDSILFTGVNVLYTSKWLNAAAVFTTDTLAVAQINAFPFVKSAIPVAKMKVGIKTKKNDKMKKLEQKFQEFMGKFFLEDLEKNTPTHSPEDKSLNYGLSYNQINMIGGVYLHDQGYQGQGMLIAVLDGGFYGVDTMAVFDSLWTNNQIIAVRDFVTYGGNVFAQSTHGMHVLSTMGGYLDGELIGTAPKANYMLLRSEDTGSEYLIEECNWVAAAEYADSLGADIINSSLGYTTFDDSTQNHTYADMDGNTAIVTRAADIAASKGILVVNSAGNSGSSAWQYIGAPADGDSVFSIGGVDPQGQYASFSSTGPSSDGQIKPNVAAQGQSAVLASPYGSITTGNGTSFSSPIMAGMSACLWQAHPNLSNMELISVIEESSSQFFSPDSLLGYGIPNFTVANVISSGIEIHNIDNEENLNVFPNPFEDHFYVMYESADSQYVDIKLIDAAGKIVFEKNQLINNVGINCHKIHIDKDITKGVYFMIFYRANKHSSTVMIKHK